MAYDNAAIDNQRAEFDALMTLISAYNALPPIVDDDYPEARHRYEGYIRTFIDAIRRNGRLALESDRPLLTIENEIAERSKKFKDNFADQNERQRYMALALAGEVGEALNIVKKEWREGRLDGKALLDEVSDVFVYWLLFCHACGWTMTRVVEHANIKAERKLQQVLVERKERETA